MERGGLMGLFKKRGARNWKSDLTKIHWKMFRGRANSYE